MEKRIALDHHSPPKLNSLSLQPIYDLIDAAEEDQFVCTTSSAEGICQVIWSVFSEVSRKEGKTQFITSCIEDAPTLQMLKRLETLGCQVKIAPVNAQGRIDVAELAKLITPRTAMITITAANGLTGVIQPVEEIIRLAKEKNLLLHLDATYVVGKTYFTFQSDYVTFSKALFAKKGRPLIPYILGAQNSPEALIEEARLSHIALDTFGLETARLRDLFETEIQKRISDSKILFKDSPRLPNTSVITFPRVHAEALRYYLERKGLFVNFGGDYSQHLHSVLEASNIAGECAVSFSLARTTTQEEIFQAVNYLEEKVAFLQKLTEDLF